MRRTKLIAYSIALVVHQTFLNHQCVANTFHISKKEEPKRLRNISLLLGRHEVDRKSEQHLEPFHEWAQTHSKSYKNKEETIHRFKTWIRNQEFIEKHNCQVPEPSFMLGHNQFSDFSQEEFQQMHYLEKSRIDEVSKDDVRKEIVASHRRKLKSSMLNLPTHVNWVQTGAVTKVKNQGQCGACWAFSTTGAIEGARFIKTNELLSLSEQNLIDCDDNDNACKGGMMKRAFQYDTEGLCSEEDYPYKMELGQKCNPSSCSPVADTGVLYYIDVPEKNDVGLRASVAMQPTSIGIDAKSIYFQFYKSGVFRHKDCGKDGIINHGVLAVGYGHDEKLDEDYYLIKNSWGENWGENGYIRVERNLRHDYGMCAILTVITTPVLK